MDFSTPIDEVSLAALKRDCRRTQERVYRAYSGPAWTLAVRLSGCEARAWDAVQGGFVRAFERIGQLERADRFGAWLRRIIVNQVMDAGRRSFEPLPDDDASSVRSIQAGEPEHPEQLDLERALDALEPIDRIVLWLHDAEGLTHAEIAELAGMTVSWSKTRLSRARTRVRNLIEAGTPTHLRSNAHAP